MVCLSTFRNHRPPSLLFSYAPPPICLIIQQCFFIVLIRTEFFNLPYSATMRFHRFLKPMQISTSLKHYNSFLVTSCMVFLLCAFIELMCVQYTNNLNVLSCQSSN